MRPEQVRWLEIQITDASITVSRHFGKCRQAFRCTLWIYKAREPCVDYSPKNIHPRTNTYDGTIKGWPAGADVDEKTVRSALLKMQEKNILAPVAPGQWMLNPRLLAKGSFLQEVKLMATYDTCQGKRYMEQRSLMIRPANL